MRYYLTVVLICISLMVNNVGHLFRGLLAICMFSWKTCLFSSSAHFKSGCFLFCGQEFLYILAINDLVDILLANIFSSQVSYLFILLMVSLAVKKLFILMLSYTLILPCLERYIQKNISKINVKQDAAYILFQEFYGFISYIQVINLF